jgi:mannosyltransferase OCH1-like enzyme
MAQVIPFIIHQTWKSKDMPTGMKNAINSWKKLNPDYSHQYYDDNDVTNYVRNFDCTHFKFDNNKLQTAFNKIKSGAGKADIFRYLIMYNVGGVYADADTVCLKSITQYLKPQDYTFIVGNDTHRHIHQWFFLCTPKHPIIKETLDNCIKCLLTETPVPVFKKPHVFKEHYRLDSIERYTGPFVMDYSIRKLIKLSLKDNYKRGEHIITINNMPYKIYISSENFTNKYALFRYHNYHEEMKNLKLTHWSHDSQLFNK